MSSQSTDRPILIYRDNDLLQFTIPNLNDPPSIKPVGSIFTGSTVGLALGSLLLVIVFSAGHQLAAIIIFFIVTIVVKYIIDAATFKTYDNTRHEVIKVDRILKRMNIERIYSLNNKENKCLIYDKSISKVIFSPHGCRRSNLNGREQISWGLSTLTIEMIMKNHQMVFSDNYSISCHSEINKHLSGDDLQWMGEELCDFLTLKLVIGTPTEAPLTPDEVQAYIDWFADVG
jgi:hypothetical protein